VCFDAVSAEVFLWGCCLFEGKGFKRRMGRECLVCILLSIVCGDSFVRFGKREAGCLIISFCLSY
jgi:hypothetical protein